MKRVHDGAPALNITMIQASRDFVVIVGMVEATEAVVLMVIIMKRTNKRRK